MCLKFMPYIPAIAVGTASIAAQAASWRVTTPILCASRRLLASKTVDRTSRRPSTMDCTRWTWSATSWKYGVISALMQGKWPRTSFRTSSAIALSVRWNRVSSDLSSKIRATSSGPRKSCSDRRSIARTSSSIISKMGRYWSTTRCKIACST